MAKIAGVCRFDWRLAIDALHTDFSGRRSSSLHRRAGAEGNSAIERKRRPEASRDGYPRPIVSRRARTPTDAAYRILGIVGARGSVYAAGVAHLAGYQPRAAEQGVLYRVIAEHLDAFLDAAAQHGDGHRLPTFVEQEFRDFLTCGVLAHGFARLRCGDCAFERLVPFSCWDGASVRAAGGDA